MVKCVSCEKKTHISLSCRCGKSNLCVSCVSWLVHDCTLNKLNENRDKIKKNNPEVRGEKISKF